MKFGKQDAVLIILDQHWTRERHKLMLVDEYAFSENVVLYLRETVIMHEMLLFYISALALFSKHTSTSTCSSQSVSAIEPAAAEAAKLVFVPV